MDPISIAYFTVYGIFFFSVAMIIAAIAYYFWERKRFKILSKQERKILGFIVKEKSTTKKQINDRFKVKSLSKVLSKLRKKRLINMRKGKITHKKLDFKTKNI